MELHLHHQLLDAVRHAHVDCTLQQTQESRFSHPVSSARCAYPFDSSCARGLRSRQMPLTSDKDILHVQL
ncbi:hypothetical protein PF002_g28869 [Phytophthora fragariae]|nr:hypothetical protein PF002_g28869 [Phytophthora fragariae]